VNFQELFNIIDLDKINEFLSTNQEENLHLDFKLVSAQRYTERIEGTSQEHCLDLRTQMEALLYGELMHVLTRTGLIVPVVRCISLLCLSF